VICSAADSIAKSPVNLGEKRFTSAVGHISSATFYGNRKEVRVHSKLDGRFDGTSNVTSRKENFILTEKNPSQISRLAETGQKKSPSKKLCLLSIEY
jgi:hypothetical protein